MADRCDDDDHDFDGHIECVVCGADGVEYAYQQAVRLSQAEQELTSLRTALAAVTAERDEAHRHLADAIAARDEARATAERYAANAAPMIAQVARLRAVADAVRLHLGSYVENDTAWHAWRASDAESRARAHAASAVVDDTRRGMARALDALDEADRG